MDDTRVERSKFETGGASPSIDAGELPWAYGEDRITAMVRDPESAYVYWEITDDGIASARTRLGASGEHGWCNLRVYDTTGREFDGTNANDYFDIGIDRRDREYFVMIRRPGSAMHVEVGIKTHEGYFQPIARSGRADFPRSSPSPHTDLEWMTVTSEDAPPCVVPCRSRYGGPEPQLPGREGAGYVDVWRAAYAPSHESAGPADGHAWGSSHHVIEHRAHIERWWHLDEWRAEWRSGLRFLRWEHHDPERVAVELLGDEPAHIHIEGGEMHVYGPWKLTIRSFSSSAEPGRRVLSTWSMRWVRASTPMIESWTHVVERRVLGKWEREHVVLGASEAHGLLERGASELLRLGGSERMRIGASEWVAMGGSETAWLGLGASELRGVAASWRMGASEWLGGSERAVASERLGGSEGVGGSHFIGASEVPGSSERWGGRLEGNEPR